MIHILILILILVGNACAMQAPEFGYRPAAMYLPSKDMLNLEVTDRGGESWHATRARHWRDIALFIAEVSTCFRRRLEFCLSSIAPQTSFSLSSLRASPLGESVADGQRRLITLQL